MENNLIVIENGQLNIYLLDNQVVWEVGRMSKEHTPDIPMHATTISRRHGRFHDAPWRAMDSRGCSKFLIVDGDTRTKLANPEPGSVVECEHGMVIYMGALTYVIGPLKVMGSKEEA